MPHKTKTPNQMPNNLPIKTRLIYHRLKHPDAFTIVISCLIITATLVAFVVAIITLLLSI